MEKQPVTYIQASRRNRTLYIGVTSDLVGRIWQHRHHVVPGFTDRYNVIHLAWHELHETMEGAISREKRIKTWNRAWKIRWIEEANTYWNDLWMDIINQGQVTGSPPSRG